jgi:hypothetical protein
MPDETPEQAARKRQAVDTLRLAEQLCGYAARWVGNGLAPDDARAPVGPHQVDKVTQRPCREQPSGCVPARQLPGRAPTGGGDSPGEVPG